MSPSPGTPLLHIIPSDMSHQKAEEVRRTGKGPLLCACVLYVLCVMCAMCYVPVCYVPVCYVPVCYVPVCYVCYVPTLPGIVLTNKLKVGCAHPLFTCSPFLPHSH